MGTQEFVELILRTEFGDGFRTVKPYRFMFESTNRLVYFQNFDVPGQKVWYRIKQRPLKRLRESDREPIICLTNPEFFYAIPLKDVDEQVEKSGWRRDDLEVNIDTRTSMWRELNWPVGKYRKEYPAS